MSDKEVLIETASVIAISQGIAENTISPDAVFITFNEMGQCVNGMNFWGDHFFSQMGVPAIGIMSREPNWFPPEDMAVVVERVRAAIRGRRVVTYGTSQGGYGALKYAKAFEASAALAFSPQWSIVPKDVERFDNRFTKFYRPELLNGSAVTATDLCSNNYIVYDPGERHDSENAQRLLRLPNTHAVLAPFSGHFAIRVLTEGRKSRAVIHSLRQTNVSPLMLRQLLRDARNTSLTYDDARVMQLLGQKRRQRDLQRFIETRDTRHAHLYQVLFAHAQGQTSNAANFLKEVSDDDIRSFELTRLWNLFRQFGFEAGELRVAALIKHTSPNDAWLALHVVNTLGRCGRNEDAIKHLEAATCMPQAATIFKDIVFFANLHNRLDIAETMINRPEFKLEGPAFLDALVLLCDAYRRADRRSSAFNLLHNYAQGPEVNAVEMRQIARYLLDMGEASYALDLINRLFKTFPDDSALDIEAMHANVILGQNDITKDIKLLLSRKLSDATALPVLRLGLQLERSRMPELAIKTVRKALEAGAPEIDCRSCMARILTSVGKKREAHAELNLLSRLPMPTISARLLGNHASAIERPDMASAFSAIQYKNSPSDPDCILYRIDKLVLNGEYTAALESLRSFTVRVMDGLVIDADQFGRLALASSSLGQNDVEACVIGEGLRRFPACQELLTRRDAASMFIGQTGSHTALKQNKPRDSLVRRLSRGFFFG